MNERPFESVRDVMANLAGYLPTLLAGFIVLVLGAVVAWIVAKLTVRILIFLRLDRVVTRMGWGRALEKGDVRHSLFGLLGTVMGVLLFLVFFDNAVVIWKLTVLSQLLEKLVLLIPQLIIAISILLIGWSIATAASRALHRALVQEEFERARLAGRILYGAILVLASAIALVERAGLGVCVGVWAGQQARRRTDVGGTLPPAERGAREGGGTVKGGKGGMTDARAAVNALGTGNFQCSVRLGATGQPGSRAAGVLTRRARFQTIRSRRWQNAHESQQQLVGS
jgi:hypothetical protein